MTEEALRAEIDEITTALSFILQGGQSYTINSGASSRTVTMTDYATLTKRREDLRAQLREIRGTGGITISAGW